MKILADFHHNDLARSLQLLFGRFDSTVYFPAGLDWFTEDYWAFERRAHGDAVAKQYLEGIWAGASADANGVLQAANPHHPGTYLTGITLDAAKAIDWDIVISSVPANAIGLRRLARETNARWLMHIGNQWGNEEVLGLRPDGLLMTTTSELSIDVPRVTIHQEFDRELFGYEPPSGFGPVSSFVNCFPENTACGHLPDGGEYGIFTRLATEAPEFDWRVYGAYGTAPLDQWAAGAIQSAGEIAERMRESSVGYHSKHWSDGFGHIVHNWFAVGRPVLGHYGFYRDKLAGPLWVEGETSFDIEGKSREEIIGLLARLRDDADYHARLCENAARRFDEIVSFDADGELVKGLLEQVLSDRAVAA